VARERHQQQWWSSDGVANGTIPSTTNASIKNKYKETKTKL